MAGPGTYTAYNQLQPLQGNIADDLARQEQFNLHRRALKQNEDELAYKKEKDKAEVQAKLLDKIKNQDPYDTGSKSKNEALAKLFAKGREAWGPVIEVLSDPNKYTKQEVVDAQIKANNLNNLVDNTKAFDDAVTKRHYDYLNGVNKGLIHRNLDYENNYQSGYQNKVLGLDDQGKPVVMFIDNNNDGVDDNTGKPKGINDYESYADMESGINKYNFLNRYDKEDLVKEAITKIQPEVNQDVNGNVIVKNTGLNKDAVDKHVTDLLYNSDGTPSDVLKSLAIQNNADVNNPKQLSALKDDFVNSINLYAKKGREESPNNEYLNWAKFNWEKSQAKKKEEQEKTTYSTVETPFIYKDNGIESAKGYKTVSVMGSKMIPLIEAYQGNKSVSYTNAKINSYTIVKNKLGKRQIVAEIVYEDTKGEKVKKENIDGTESTDQAIGAKNKSAVVTLTQKDAVKFARQMGFKNTTEMANQARAGKEIDSRPKTVVQNGHTYTLDPKTGEYK